MASFAHNFFLFQKKEYGSFVIEAYNRNIKKTFLFYFLCLVTAGALFLLARWMSSLKLWLSMDKSRLDICSHIHVIPRDKENSTSKIIQVFDGKDSSRRFFSYRQTRYVWGETFFSRASFNTNLPFEEIHSMSRGHSEKSYQVALEKFGQNSMTIPVKSYVYLTLRELSNPFYVFQIFSIILWCVENYIGTSFSLSFFSSATNLLLKCIQ